MVLSLHSIWSQIPHKTSTGSSKPWKIQLWCFYLTGATLLVKSSAASVSLLISILCKAIVLFFLKKHKLAEFYLVAEILSWSTAKGTSTVLVCLFSWACFHQPYCLCFSGRPWLTKAASRLKTPSPRHHIFMIWVPFHQECFLAAMQLIRNLLLLKPIPTKVGSAWTLLALLVFKRWLVGYS